MKNLDQLTAEALKRLAEFINRSAGQHLRAMREKAMHTDQVEEFSSLDQFAESDSAYKQHALDLFYMLGCQYAISNEHMKELCSLACINYDDLLKYAGVQPTH